ncbi:hypothetical protein GGTG_02421 [Gaeumannomyces tritici R3-111a-1]|uniref:Uncharacterized protein n=1 Tax=Gaeumannomyces tritici (strain R3-111a-1) TaxID=644352 RepID=J3NMB7_GAET3|nr:hypothetical protein GGTG_02421 [Gaeumannomyces tritici R3-111a-1]EJT82448.1 hypothetical protein GGTG_02421 [Gaeumannomyces tritici R3-111a-1]
MGKDWRMELRGAVHYFSRTFYGGKCIWLSSTRRQTPLPPAPSCRWGLRGLKIPCNPKDLA